ncbi:NERD domain-containing protein [Gillisia sp. Hel_I_29]|uniref:NERD domain-containing protein n=1 Tax=Gillisia sp. Hel_I_29 TaxID=1249975 RepID=UPI000555D867|nr:NERD domain-containing protein [Gillisia sp. Hel_I_29]
MTKLEKYIKNNGGVLSGDLARYIEKNQGVSNDAARKRIQRLSSPIHKITGLFSDKKSFIYHADNYQNSDYFDDLVNAFKSDAKRCYTIINAIKYHHGLISINELPNYSMSPVKPILGHMKFSSLIEKLKKHNLIRETREGEYGLNIFIAEQSAPNFRHIKGIEISKKIILQHFETWSKNIGLVSFKKGKNNHIVGGFQFAFTAPTYIDGLIGYNNRQKKPGFLVADILIGNVTDEDAISFFLRKLATIKASNPALKLFPVLLVDGIGIKALNQLKSNGVLVASVKELFGKDYSDLIKNLINTVTNAGAILKTEPEKYISLLSKLIKLIDGKTNNLRGDLFELAVGFYFGKYSQSINIGKRVPVLDSIRSREIDVLAITENEVCVVECKGYNYTVDIDYIEEYLSEKVKEIRGWLSSRYPEKRQRFEIWSTGGFTKEAVKLLKETKSKVKKYDFDYLSQTEIKERANRLNSDKFKEILRDYFLKEIV